MRNKQTWRRLLSSVICVAMLGTSMAATVSAQTLSEAGLTEGSRGYGGAGNQNKSRTEDAVTVKVSVGGGGTKTDDWTQLAEWQSYIAADGVDMHNRSMSVRDVDIDGDLDMTDLVLTLEGYKRGSVEEAHSTSSTGDFYTSLFGIDGGGSFTYWLNGSYCQYGTPDLYDNDSIIICALTGAYNSWGTTDDSAYDGARGATVYNSIASIINAGSAGAEVIPDTPVVPDNPTTPVNPSYTTYLKKLEEKLASWDETISLSDGSCYWQEMRILRFANGSSSVYQTKLPIFTTNYVNAKAEELAAGSLKAVNAMRVASVTKDDRFLDVLAHGYGDKDAATYCTTAGMYSVDYILMCLDLNAYAADEEMATNLSDYASSPSVRDDLINYILSTPGCWGGGWWTYDTGAQNAQAVVPYYNKYPEVKEKVDTYNAQAYAYFMDASNTGATFDASSAGEYIRLAAMISKVTGDNAVLQQAQDVYNKIQTIGLENTKYKGNSMDITRMAIAEWGLNEVSASGGSEVPSVTTGELHLFVEQGALNQTVSSTVAHLRAEKDINDAQLYECVLSIPEGIVVQEVTSSVANVTYGIEGQILRATVSNLDGTNLTVLKDTDLLQLKLSATTAGNYKITVLSSLFRSSSEESRTSSIETEEFEIAQGASITATTLYTGNATSRFVGSDKQAVKLVFGTAININGYMQLKVGEQYFDCYETTDFATAEGTSCFVAIVPTSVTVEQLQDVNNYFVVEGSKKSVKFGDLDADSSITSADALWLVKLWVGQNTNPTGVQVLAGNVTKDTDIDNADTLSIVEKIVNGEQFKVLK